MYDNGALLPATILCLLLFGGLCAIAFGFWWGVAGAVFGGGLGFAADVWLLREVSSGRNNLP